MAYNRTRRFPKLISQTPADIGPGTYDLSDVSCPKRHLAEFSPFLCGTKRETVIVPRDADRYPGPGSHDIKEPQRHIPERVSIDFTEARFKEQISEGPGPVDYKVELVKCGKIRTHPGTWRGPPGKLWLIQPPRSIIPTPTSVPDKNYTGYSLNRYGFLVKNPPITKEPNFFYNIPRGEMNTTTIIYKGNFWSRMSGRTELKQFLTPSPGDYEHEKKKTPWEIETERIREARRMSTWQPRYLDALYRTKMRENLPGPNCYNVKGSFEKYFKIPCKCDPYSLEPPPFGQTSKRFDDKPRTDIPGPGTYESFQGIKCVGSIFPAAFGVCATRFKHDPEDSGPGPSDYYPLVGNLAYESEKRYRYTYQKPSYPEIYSDDISFYDDDDDYYDACSPERAEENKSKVYHAAFKSRAERFPNPAKDVPGPGAYEVLKSYKRNRNKCEFLCPATAPAFGTRSSRMPKQVVLETPDPTYYNLATDIAENVKGGVISQSRRHHERPLAPSPNRYCIHPYLSSSVLKKSFNITLGKPKVVEKLEPTKQKKRCPCRRKKLLWFTVAPREYWECQPETY